MGGAAFWRSRSDSGTGSLRGCSGRTCLSEAVGVGGASDSRPMGGAAFWRSRSGGSRTLRVGSRVADPKRSSKDAERSSNEAKRSWKEAGRSSNEAKRSSKDALRHADTGSSPSVSCSSAVASKPACGSRLATRTRSTADCDPIGARNRKMSGWIVPKTEILGRSARSPISAGPACVPGDLRTNPKTIATIPNGTERTPTQTNAFPHSYYASPVAASIGNALPRRQEARRLRQESFLPIPSARPASCTWGRGCRLVVCADTRPC